MNSFNKDAKKNLITASLVGLVVAVSSNAHAASISNINFLDRARLYVGLGFGYNKYNLSKAFKSAIELPTNRGSIKGRGADLLVPVLGIKFPENYGVEFGYQYQSKLKFKGVTPGNLRLRNAYVDSMGYMPISNRVDLIGGLGIGCASIKENSALQAMGNGGKYRKLGFRAKIGAQYYLSSNCSYRGILGYQRIGDHSGKQSIKSVQYLHLDFTYLI